MRRLIAIAALACLAACSDTKAPGDAEPSSPPAGATATATPAASPGGDPSASPAPGVPGGAARDAVCDAYLKAEGEVGAKLVVILPKVADAMADPSKAAGVLTELKAVLKGYEAALSAEAGRSPDGELKAAVEADLAAIRAALKEIEAAGNDMEKVLGALDSPEFQKLGEKVRTLCGE